MTRTREGRLWSRTRRALIGIGSLLLAVGAWAQTWAPGTVWPARVPVRLRIEVDEPALVAWMADAGRLTAALDRNEARDFLAAAAHALGSELGDAEEALALRDPVEVAGGTFVVTVVARDAATVAETANRLLESELLKRAARVQASVGWATGPDAAARLRQNPAVAKVAEGEWTSPREMLAQLRALADLDPGWLFPPDPALNEWRSGPGRGRAPRLLEALRAPGVYTDPDPGPYAAWDPATRRWQSVLLFQGQVFEGGKPLPKATAIVRLLEAGGAPAEDRGRLDAAASGPDGAFFVALRGAQADRYAGSNQQFRIGVNKWGYEWVGLERTPRASQITDVGSVELRPAEQAADGGAAKPENLLLAPPEGYRTLMSHATDEGGEQRLYTHRSRRMSGSTRLFSSSGEILHAFERVGADPDAARWLDRTLDPEAARRARRTTSTRHLEARMVRRQADRGELSVTENGEWKLDDGMIVYYTGETRILAFALGGYRIRLQVTAVGTSNRPGERDPEGLVAAVAGTASALGVQVEQALAAPSAAVLRVDLRGTWREAERLTGLYANLLRLEHGSVRLDSGEYDPIARHMPLARQPIRVEDEPLTIIVGDGVQVTAEPNAIFRLSHDGRLRFVSGAFHLKTPVPRAETDAHLRNLAGLIFQAQRNDDDFARSVTRAVQLGHISSAYGAELTTLSRDSALRSLFTTCGWLAPDDMQMPQPRVPFLVFGEADLTVHPSEGATLACRSGRAFLADEAFTGVAALEPGRAAASRPGDQPFASATD